jgi:hypothetical protein
VNIDLNRSNNGGLSFDIDLKTSDKKINKAGIYERKLKPEFLANSYTSMTTSLTEYTEHTDRTQKTQKSEMSLGAKIQQKASNDKLIPRNLTSNRSSALSDRTTTGSISSSLSSNRTLELRQKSAKDKRDSFNKAQQLAYQLSAAQNASNSKVKKTQLGNQSLTPQQSILNTTNSNHAAAKDSFLRRKMYDPQQAVEQEKLKKQSVKGKLEELEPILGSHNDLSSQFKNGYDKQVIFMCYLSRLLYRICFLFFFY